MKIPYKAVKTALITGAAAIVIANVPQAWIPIVQLIARTFQ